MYAMRKSNLSTTTGKNGKRNGMRNTTIEGLQEDKMTGNQIESIFGKVMRLAGLKCMNYGNYLRLRMCILFALKKKGTAIGFYY
jgi:hypothetical protein